jgi:hypothetical protein
VLCSVQAMLAVCKVLDWVLLCGLKTWYDAQRRGACLQAVLGTACWFTGLYASRKTSTR